MGLFDVFRVKNARCELCGHIYDADFQSKVFDPVMRVIKQGEDLMKALNDNSHLAIKEGDFEMHDVCPNCNKYFETRRVIKNYIFIGQKQRKKKGKNE